MAAITGQSGRVKITAATASSSTNNTATLSTDGVTLQIDSTSKRHWSKALSTGLTVFEGAGDVTSEINSAETNYVQGIVTFSTPHSTSASYTIDVDSLTASNVALIRGWSVDVSVDMHDVTTFSTSATDVAWRTKRPGLAGASVSIDALLQDSTAATYFDRLNNQDTFVVELVASTADQWEGFAYIESDAVDVPVDGLPTENVTLMIDGQLFRTT